MADCSYHPGKEAVGACVNCGKMVCLACRTELQGKVYCQPCANQLFMSKADAVAAPSTPSVQPVSGAWWLLVILPILFGGWNWIGGLIAWAVTRNKDPKKARSFLIWGIVLSVIFIVVAIVATIILVIAGYTLEMAM